MNKRGNKRADGFKVISSILNKIGLFSSIRRLSPSVSSIHQLRSSLNIANTLSPYTHITSSQTLTPISVTAKQTRFLIKSIPSLLILVLGLLIFSGTALAAQYGSPFEVFGAFEWDDKNYENYWNSIYNHSLFYNNSENIGIRVMTPSEVLTVNGNMSVNDSFYVLDSGNVGIGTSTPSSTLNVVGDLNVTGTSYLGQITINTQNITTAGILARAGDKNNLTIYNATGSAVMKVRGDGKLEVWNPEEAANDYVSIYHDGSQAGITTGVGALYLGAASLWVYWDGTTFQSNSANSKNLGGTTYEWRALYLGENASSGIYFGVDQDSLLKIDGAQAGQETLMWSLPTASKTLVLTDNANVANNHDHPAQSNPTIFVHSNLDPDSDNTKWASVSHDNVSMVLDSGSDRIVLDDNTTVSGDLVLGDNDVGNVLVDMYDNSTEFVIDVVHNVTFITAEVVSMEKAFKLVPQAAGTWPVGCNANSAGAMFVNATGNNLCFCDGSNWLFVSNNSGC